VEQGRESRGEPGSASPPVPAFQGLLSRHGRDDELGTEPEDRSFAVDLNLDQIIDSVAGEREERELITTLLYRQVRDPETLRYRHEVFRDLEDRDLLEGVERAVRLLREVRSHLAQVKKMRSKYQQEGWFLDAAALYCEAVQILADQLHRAELGSGALRDFRDFLDSYRSSPSFEELASATSECRASLGRVRYDVRIHGGRVEVSRYEGDPDYSTEVLTTFERFAQGAVKDYRVAYRTWPGMTHVGERIVELVARLFPEEFTALDAYWRRHGGFFDPGVRRFEREIQFYLAYLDYITPLRRAGLPFCYPQLGSSKEVSAAETFDLALATKLVAARAPIVRNDFELCGAERVFVVSGPNQGGKTTFARTFGQLHHLASVGLPVPGSEARLVLFDRLFTHFGREDDITKMRGKLEDDLARVRRALLEASPASVMVLNEIFSSTTLHDARYLGKKVLTKMIELDLLGVYVTFVDELADFAPSMVSMVSTVVPGDPAQRTFKILRGPANGRAYALAIAEKHNLTYHRLRERVGS
jgi:DNA mismatch repair protein MutS